MSRSAPRRSPPSPPPAGRSPTSLEVKVGGWFEARANGWGVLAVPLVLIAVLVAGALRMATG